jgi:cyclomaltodextrinase / maltogenic alpha-amylase / neopullulanase
MKWLYSILLCLVLLGCNEPTKKVAMTKFDEAPEWAKSAIWYQIFVERFRNGNNENNPNFVSMKGALIDEVPNTWTLTPWNHNWYKEEEWAKQSNLDFYRTIQMRRYGGDLKGVLDKIDYLKDLGINAVYFNPLNDAPSLHKYDARSYHHIDVSFGNDRDGDLALLKTEKPNDPSTWVWTNADKLFLEVIKKMHAKGIKVILDYSWNHTGTEFWAFKDIIKNVNQSHFKDWYEIKSLDDPNTQKNEFDYDGWFGIKSLPELKKLKQSDKIQGHAYEGNLPAEVKEHIFAVCKRWMDPNGDGNLNDGIDGMRLDVAEHVPLGFWRDLRKFVRSVNPDFYLVGENWWTKWPDELMNAEPWLRGDIFDAVMHYHWYKPARAYINQGDDRIDLKDLYDQFESLFSKYRPSTQHALMNLVSSHDSERVLSSLNNSNKYKYQSKPSENRAYDTGRPNQLAYDKFFVLLIHQFTFVGSPHIWNGDEMGMWGADDPDNRKPLIWQDIDFDVEHALYNEQKQYSDKPEFNKTVFNFYAALCKLRTENIVLQSGVCEFDKSLIDQNIFSYKRTLDDESIVVILNAESFNKNIDLSAYKGYHPIYSHKVDIIEQKLAMQGFSGIVLKKQ